MRLDEISSRNTFWISPRGDIIKSDDYHIMAIIRNPIIFNIPKSKIESIMRTSKDDFSDEEIKSFLNGKSGQIVDSFAADDIEQLAMKNGFIRGETNSYRETLNLTIDKMSMKVVNAIKKFAEDIVHGRSSVRANGNTPVLITSITQTSMREKRFTVHDLADGRGFVF